MKRMKHISEMKYSEKVGRLIPDDLIFQLLFLSKVDDARGEGGDPRSAHDVLWCFKRMRYLSNGFSWT